MMGMGISLSKIPEKKTTENEKIREETGEDKQIRGNKRKEVIPQRVEQGVTAKNGK